MAVIAACGALLLLGGGAVLRWGDLDVRRPAPPADHGARPAIGGATRLFVWNVTVAVVAGVGAGVVVAGAGGRLAMRLLAVTAGDRAQGALTEADQRIGRITVAGTLDFVVFVTLFFGLASAAVYLLVRRWLPPGRAGGSAYGVLLLVVAGPRIEPIRPTNRDFDLVGPGWLSLVVLGGTVVLHGMAVAALAGRYSRVLPLLSPHRRSLVAHLPLVLLLPMVPAALVVAVAGAIGVAVARIPGVVEAFRSPAATVAGRVALALVALVAFPGFADAVLDIARRGS